MLIEQPLYLDFLAQIGGWDNNAACMQWRPQEGARVHLVTLDGSKVGLTGVTASSCSWVKAKRACFSWPMRLEAPLCGPQSTEL